MPARKSDFSDSSSTSPKREHVVTQREVARRANVSSSVVSYVINGGPRYVAEETRRRVLEAIDELGYRPNKFAQALKARTPDGTPRTAERQIGIVVGGDTAMLKRAFWAAVLAGVYDEAYRQGRRVRFMHFFDELQDPILFNEHIHPEEISELILVAPQWMIREPVSERDAQRRLLARMTERISNVVCLGQSINDLPAVIFDQADAARKATRHLVSLGHRQIAYVGRDDERIDGYTQTLRAHGIEPDPALISLAQELPPLSGYEAALHLLDSNPPPFTAIFASNDETAVGVLGALVDRGIRIPDQVALVGIHDTPIARMIRPALTTVRVPKELMGSYAIRLLQNRRDDPASAPISVVLPTELVVRQSCGAQR